MFNHTLSSFKYPGDHIIGKVRDPKDGEKYRALLYVTCWFGSSSKVE